MTPLEPVTPEFPGQELPEAFERLPIEEERHWWSQFGLTLDQAAQVRRRIGDSRVEHLQWALNLAQDNLKKWTPGDWQVRREELAVFLDAGMREQRMAPPISANIYPSVDHVRQVQHQFHQVVRKLAEVGAFNFGSFKVAYRLVLPNFFDRWRTDASRANLAKALNRPDTRKLAESLKKGMQSVNKAYAHELSRTRVFQGSPSRLALLRLAQLCRPLASAIRRCPDSTCGRWFVAIRKNQDYCSRTHAVRSAKRAQRLREKKGA